MARLGLRKEVVHEIDIAHECCVPERGVDRVRLSAANERGRTCATELRDLLAAGLYRTGSQSGDAAAQRIKNMDWQLLARLGREVGKSSAGCILRETFDLSHQWNPPFLFSELICLGCEGDENPHRDHRADHAEEHGRGSLPLDDVILQG